MSFDVLLFLLRVAFLVLLYVFLIAVVRVAWGGLRRTAEARDSVVPPSSQEVSVSVLLISLAFV